MLHYFGGLNEQNLSLDFRTIVFENGFGLHMPFEGLRWLSPLWPSGGNNIQFMCFKILCH